ncbi:tyrosine-protein kinase-like otk [Planococcus citri]|uniref:tyrosine-protein kinase-like otk n=1 Tax=Planococcus citri TaxID=170843 RepID=UPI0031FA3DE5
MIRFLNILLFVSSIVGDTWEKEIFTSQGKRLELPCNHSNQEIDATVVWKINDSDVSLSGRRYLQHANLIIERVDRFQDAGQYHCEVENIRSNYFTKPDAIFVRVNWIDEQASVALISPQHLSQLQLGSNISLKCIASGSSHLKIDWFKNGERISNNDRISIEDDILRINRANALDNGIYRCRASNDGGSVDSSKTFSLKIKSENCANLNVISQDETVKEGSSVVLNCLYEKYDILEWYFNENGPIKNDSRITLSSNTSSLYIHNVRKSDEGMYACVGVKKECDTYPTKYTIILSVADFEKTNSSLLEPSDRMTHVVAEGANFTIACIPPKGKPTPVISWKNQADEKINTAGSIRQDNYHLRITNAKREVSGKYTCRAENLASFVEVSFNLTVVAPPQIIVHPSSQTVHEGSGVSLRCKYKATASPFTEISWRKNNIRLMKNASNALTSETDGSLNLSKVESTDAGEYSCVITTKFYPPVISQSATLTVIQKLKFNPLPVAKKMELGLANKIPCKAEGSEPPSVQWIKANFEGHPVPFPNHVQDINGTLYFSKVRSEDKGRYTCIASNRQGSINVTIDVDVVVAPKFTILPKSPSEGLEKSSVRLDCAAEGDPVPTIQWNNNLVDISQKRFTTFANGSLLINELHLSDAGTYGCIAGNSGGFNKTEVILVVRSTDGNTIDGSLDSGESDTVGRTVAITLGAACAYILLVISLMAWCRYRRRKKKRTYSDLNVDSVPMDDAEETKLQSNTSELKESSKHIQNGGGAQHMKRNSSFSKYLSENCVGLEFSRKNLHDIMLLGNGELGNVFLARNKCEADAIVMVKVLEEMTPEFRRQLDILKQVDHEHIIRLIGICREAEPIYMILEYTDWGDLKQFLIATRKSSVRVVGNKQRPPPLTLKQSLKIVEEAASALEHFAQRRCTHRDVATRNCLITSSLSIKITFSSLCKNTYATEYYEIRGQFLPLRWLPFEAVAEGEFSNKTDVYSFSCFVWEIFTKGELPFSKLSNEEVLSLLEKRQLRWKMPKSMPSNLAKLLTKCWSVDAAERPTFAQIIKEISEIKNLVNQT